MNFRNRQWIVPLLLAVAVSASAAGAEPTLKVGSPAPRLQTGKWVQGEPVREFDKGKAYLIEFWATWCGPCRTSIPHLNEVHRKYKDKGLVVIGQDCWERDESLVGPFLKSMGDKMTYRVALDDKAGNERGRMAATWMDAAGRAGIPSAFLVDTKGMVAWIGHPMQLQDKVIEEVLKDGFDLTRAAQEYDRQQSEEASLRSEMARFSNLIASKDFPGAYSLAAQLSDRHKDNVPLLDNLAWRIATDPTILQRDLPLAEKIARRANEAAKGENASVLDTLARVLFMQRKKQEAVDLAEKAVQLASGNLKTLLQQSLDSYKRGELPAAN